MSKKLVLSIVTAFHLMAGFALGAGTSPSVDERYESLSDKIKSIRSCLSQIEDEDLNPTAMLETIRWLRYPRNQLVDYSYKLADTYYIDSLRRHQHLDQTEDGLRETLVNIGKIQQGRFRQCVQ